MDQKSQVKVLNAGFNIIRIQDEPVPVIKIKTKEQQEWHNYGKFENKAIRNRCFKTLLDTMPRYIAD
jgi:hypothetical protein